MEEVKAAPAAGAPGASGRFEAPLPGCRASAQRLETLPGSRRLLPVDPEACAERCAVPPEGAIRTWLGRARRASSRAEGGRAVGWRAILSDPPACEGCPSSSVPRPLAALRGRRRRWRGEELRAEFSERGEQRCGAASEGSPVFARGR